MKTARLIPASTRRFDRLPPRTIRGFQAWERERKLGSTRMTLVDSDCSEDRKAFLCEKFVILCRAERVMVTFD